jgi:hypothetical protein
MSLSGVPLAKLNENVDFAAITSRYKHKLLRGNFAIVPSKSGTFIFALLGNAYALKKIMTTQTLLGLHYIDYANEVPKFDPKVFAENTLEWFQGQAKLNGFREVKQFIHW